LVKRTYRFLARLLIAALVCTSALAVVVALRLMSGPMELEFLKDRLRHTIDTASGKVAVDAERVMVEWGGLGHPVRLTLVDIAARDDNGRVLASAPSLAVDFDAGTLISGQFAPRAAIISGLTVGATIGGGGALSLSAPAPGAAAQGGALPLLIEQLSGASGGPGFLGSLDRVEVERAQLVLRDSVTGLVLNAPDARATLSRERDGVAIAARARFGGGATPVSVSLRAQYARDRSGFTFSADLEGVRPSLLAGESGDLALLGGFDLPLSGRVAGQGAGDGTLGEIAVALRGNDGRLSLPGQLAGPLAIDQARARIAVDVAARRLRIEEFDVDFAGPRLSLNGAAMLGESGATPFQLEVDFALTGVPTSRVGEFWSPALAAGGRRWALANLSDGDVALSGKVALAGDRPDTAQVMANTAMLAFRGVTVRYMPDMPPVEHAEGHARFIGSDIRFEIASGRGAGLTVTRGTVDLTGLDAAEQNAAIDLTIVAPAPTVLEFLAQPKLGLPRDVLFDPKRIAGDATVRVKLGLPLLDALKVDDIRIEAGADVSAFGLKQALGNADLSDGKMQLDYGPGELRVSGQATLDGHPAEIQWRELFGPRPPFRRRYELKGTFPSNLSAKAGLPSLEPHVVGPVGASVSYQVAVNGTAEVATRLDIKAARATIPQLDWTKAAGADGLLTSLARLSPGAKLASVDFDGRAAGLSARGQARFATDGALQQLALQQLAIGRSDLAIDWRPTTDGMEVGLRGRALEWGRVREFLRARDREQSATGAVAGPPRRVGLTLGIDQVVLERGTAGSLTGSVTVLGDRIQRADLSLGGGGGSSFKVAPAGAVRSVALYIADFGALLRSAGWLDGFGGSWFYFDGRFEDQQAGAPLVGKVKLGPYRFLRSPGREGVGNLNSTIDALYRAGNAEQQFEHFDADISKAGDRLSLVRAATHGPSIGLTARGTIDLASDTLNLAGIVVPGFAINNLLSNVPLLGPLLTGGRDGGLFAIPYRLEGPIDDPKTTLSAVGAIAPGALRELLTAPVDPTAPPPPGRPASERAP